MVAGGWAERAAKHRSCGETQETCDISQTDFCLHTGMEATGRGHGDVWVYCLLGVKGPWSGQQGALPVKAG